QPTFVHADFGPHNILWHAGRAVSLIDFDNACLGDPAIDIAPLIGEYGATAVASIVEPPVLERAMVPRAALSLQVACAAQLTTQHTLQEHAVHNFTRRATTGTLYDPAGQHPPRREAPHLES
ncbi:MAG: phosphotransferase family protein, partial [Janthinobacterium lividum]